MVYRCRRWFQKEVIRVDPTGSDLLGALGLTFGERWPRWRSSWIKVNQGWSYSQVQGRQAEGAVYDCLQWFTVVDGGFRRRRSDPIRVDPTSLGRSGSPFGERWPHGRARLIKANQGWLKSRVQGRQADASSSPRLRRSRAAATRGDPGGSRLIKVGLLADGQPLLLQKWMGWDLPGVKVATREGALHFSLYEDTTDSGFCPSGLLCGCALWR